MKHLILIVVTLFTFLGTHAQEDRRERIKSLKIAYLTENLELTPGEAQKFWPIYNAHEEAIYNLKVLELGKLKRRLNREGMASLTDAEAVKIIDQFQRLERQIFEQEQKFIGDLRVFMNPRKVVYLGVLEENFRRELLRKYQHRKGSND